MIDIGTLVLLLLYLWLLRVVYDNFILVIINYIRAIMGKDEWPRIKKRKTKK